MSKVQLVRTHPCHIPFPRPLDMLGPGARRLAKKSANRLAKSSVAKVVAKLGRLIRDERDAKLSQGDLLVVLVDRHRLRPVDLARQLNCRANHLSEVYHVAKMFPARSRRSGVPYTHYWMAMRTVRKFKQIELSPALVLAEIAQQGFTQHRDVTRHFAAKVLESQNRLSMQRASEPSGTLNRCYHAPFQSLLSVFADGSIKLIWADPPYSNYRRVTDGRYTGGSVTSTACDSEAAPQAIAVTVDLLRDWGQKLADDGVLLLWQASGPLRRPILDAIDANGWEIESIVVWDKQNLAPGDFETPYSTQTEWCWVVKKRGVRLRNHDGSSRSDIVRMPPAFKSAALDMHAHAFEKPVALCRHFLGKHTFGGELVFEPFGCTGSMCSAAAENNRLWVYAESHLANFALGSTRLASHLNIPARAAG